MKKIFALIGGVAALAGVGFAYYRYGLSDSDRQALGDMAGAARNLFDEVRSAVEPSSAQEARSSEAERVANREDTRSQWEELGY